MLLKEWVTPICIIITTNRSLKSDVQTYTYQNKCQFYYSSYDESSKSTHLWMHAFPTIYILEKKKIQNLTTRNNDVTLKALLLRMFCSVVIWQHIWLSPPNTLHIHHVSHPVNDMIQMNNLVGISDIPFHYVFKNELCLLGFNLEFINIFFFCMLCMTKIMKRAFKTFVCMIFFFLFFLNYFFETKN